MSDGRDRMKKTFLNICQLWSSIIKQMTFLCYLPSCLKNILMHYLQWPHNVVCMWYFYGWHRCTCVYAHDCECLCLYMKVCVGQSNHGGSDEAKWTTVYGSRGMGRIRLGRHRLLQLFSWIQQFSWISCNRILCFWHMRSMSFATFQLFSDIFKV